MADQICCCFFGPCCDCVKVAAVWRITVAGVVNGTCTTCDDYNGTFLLSPQRDPTQSHVWLPGACIFTTNDQSPTCFSHHLGDLATWEMTCTNLFANGTAGVAVASYALVGVFQCCKLNTFALTATEVDCTGWPSVIVATPIQGNC